MLEWFDRLIAEGEAGIQRLIDERTQETVQLDFKTKKDAGNGSFSDDDKRNLGKAISAFSNSAGGLLIWGVTARKDEEGVDRAIEPPIPIAEIERFKAQANDLVGQLIQPKHDGIRAEAIASASTQGSGFLLVGVERSERRPHRSEAKNDGRYYKRAGSNSFAMEHYDIEDAFARRSSPELRPETIVDFQQCVTTGMMNIVQIIVRVTVALRNTGTVTARNPYIAMSQAAGGVPRSALDLHSIGVTSFAGETIFDIGSHVIHPNTSRAVCIFTRSYDAAVQPRQKGVISKRVLPISTEIRFGCMDARQKVGHIEITADEIARVMHGYVDITD